MAIELITGRAGTPHVDSADVGAYNAAAFGSGAYILTGAAATKSASDANTIHIAAGELQCEGRHIRITGSGEDLRVDNGLTSYKRNDIIAARYSRDGSGIETVALVVVKGSQTTGTPADPAMPSTGKLLDGASTVYWPLYRIVLNGLNVSEPVRIAGQPEVYKIGVGEAMPSGSDLNSYVKPGVYSTGSNGLNNYANAPSGISSQVVMVVAYGANSGVVTQKIIIPNPTTMGYEWERRYNSESWSAWKCVSGIDSIIAEGTSGSWYYRKWSSGKYECWMQTAGLQTQYSYNGFQFAQGSYNFPVTFKSIPQIMVTPYSATDNFAATVYEQTTAKVSIRLCALQNAAAWALGNIYVIGEV